MLFFSVHLYTSKICFCLCSFDFIFATVRKKTVCIFPYCKDKIINYKYVHFTHGFYQQCVCRANYSVDCTSTCYNRLLFYCQKRLATASHSLTLFIKYLYYYNATSRITHLHTSSTVLVCPRNNKTQCIESTQMLHFRLQKYTM